MTNLKYDQVPDLIGTGDLNWDSDHIQALLCRNVAFVSNQKRLSDVMVGTAAVKIQTTDVQGRAVSSLGQALGLPATFPKVSQDTDYQVLLTKDDGTGNDVLVAFYDVDENGGPLRIVNTGTMIVRPFLLPDGEPPTIGVWFVL